MDMQSNHDPRCMGCPQCDAEWNARRRKSAICQALRAFMEQRPGFDTRNYTTMRDYRQDQRRAQRQLHDARELLRAVEGCDDISADALLRAAESGRLSIREVSGCTALPPWRIHYCAGQYWCTEFRAGVCRVLSSALWDCERENMPAPMSDDGQGNRLYSAFEHGHKSPTAMTAGDYLRNTFRQRFGKSLAARRFN